jgi:hypothetical protein
MIDGKEHITAAEAADQLETTITRVLMLLREKALAGTCQGGAWYVALDSVACAKVHGVERKTVTGCASHCSSGGCGCS